MKNMLLALAVMLTVAPAFAAEKVAKEETTPPAATEAEKPAAAEENASDKKAN